MTAPLAMLLTCAALAAPAPLDDPTGDLKTLQGTWEATIRGPANQSAAMTLVIDGNDFTMTFAPPNSTTKMEVKGTIKLDEKADPKQVDLVDLEAVSGPKNPEDLHGIYKIEGETFTLCPPRTPRDPRPTEFPEDDDTGPNRLLVFKKQAEASSDDR